MFETGEICNAFIECRDVGGYACHLTLSDCVSRTLAELGFNNTTKGSIGDGHGIIRAWICLKKEYEKEKETYEKSEESF